MENDLDKKFQEILKWALGVLHGYSSEKDRDQAEKLIGHCALYFSSEKDASDGN